jgi:hypothetical protein
MSEFPSEPSIEVARRLEIRGYDSSSWIAILVPLQNLETALDGLRADLSALLQRKTRLFDLRGSTFETLRALMHEPSDDIAILMATASLGQEKWASLDLMRSALERRGPVVLWISLEAFAELAEFAPNIRSFIGASVFVSGHDGGIMSATERQGRLDQLSRHYGYSHEEILRKAEARELSPEPRLVEWLVLLGRGDLV